MDIKQVDRQIDRKIERERERERERMNWKEMELDWERKSECEVDRNVEFDRSS